MLELNKKYLPLLTVLGVSVSELADLENISVQNIGQNIEWGRVNALEPDCLANLCY